MTPGYGTPLRCDGFPVITSVQPTPNRPDEKGETMSNLRIWILGASCGVLAATSLPAQTFDLPFRAEEFYEGNLKILWGRAKHGTGIQEWGYDLGAVRYDADAKKWTELTVSDAKYAENKTNSRWNLYGKNVYAMRDGKVIACWRNAPENPPGGEHPKIDEGFIYGGGNGFWIEHSDGTRAEYAHFIPGSVPSALCPHNDALLPTKIASPDVTDAWPQIRVASGATVKKGELLGRVGNAGTSSNPHIHIHLEQGGTATTTKSGGSAVQMNFRRGLSTPRDDGDSDPSWTSFAGKPIPQGPVLVWPPRTLSSEFARHRFPADRFQNWFDHLTDSGLWLTSIDTYSVGGKDFINHVWRPAKSAWRAHFLVSGQKHQTNTTDADAAGFSPVLVESSVSGGQPRYTAVFVKGEPSDLIMRHGLTTQQHDTERAAAKTRNLFPVNISVVSIGGERQYTVLYRPEKIGGYMIRSQIPESGFQAEYDENKAAGRRPIYLNGYMHNGQPFLSAIFATQTPTGSDRKDRHAMSFDKYQDEWTSAINAKMFTRTVTAFDGAQSQHRYAAAWWK